MLEIHSGGAGPASTGYLFSIQHDYPTGNPTRPALY